MKLRLDEYYYIIDYYDWDWEELEKYMPKEIADKFNEFKKTHTDDEFPKYINKLYSYIEIIDTEYHINEIDLDASYITYSAIIKINDKYYSFYYDVCPYRWFEDRIYINQELQEVKPKKKTIIVYE